MGNLNNQFFQCAIYYPAESQFTDGDTFPFTIDIMPYENYNIEVNSMSVLLRIGSAMVDWQYSWSSMTMQANTHYSASHTYILNASSFGYYSLWMILEGDCFVHDLSESTSDEHYSFSSDLRLFGPDLWTSQDFQESLNSLNQTDQLQISDLKTNLGVYQDITIALTVAVILLLVVTLYFAKRRTKVVPHVEPMKKTHEDGKLASVSLGLRKNSVSTSQKLKRGKAHVMSATP
jgi:hypothetical protein